MCAIAVAATLAVGFAAGSAVGARPVGAQEPPLRSGAQEGPARSGAQEGPPRSAASWSEAAAGSELERYLRIAQIGGDIPLGEFTARTLSPSELDAYTPAGEHPWRGRFAPLRKSGWWIVRPSSEIVANTGFPYGYNDGPMWAGRGLTGTVAGGIAMRWRWLSAQIAPQAWWTQNASFGLLPVNTPTHSPYGDFAGGGIDLPQRFGPSGLGRIDPGESYVRVDAFGIGAGLSTAADWWGPGVSGGVLMSNNAGGIPRVFIGTSSMQNIGIGRVDVRAIAGQLMPSGVFHYTNNPTGAELATGVVGVYSPRGLPGLELGGIRFFHQHWRAGGPTLKDLSTLWSSLSPDVEVSGFIPGNELASLFARLVLPGSGLEVYTEFARDDANSFNNLDLITEPEHDALTMFGFQKRSGAKGAHEWWVVHGEVTDARTTHLDQVRHQVLFYQHGFETAGHTLRGQLLGSPFVRGGSGAELGVDHYTVDGRASIRWTRQGLAVNQQGGLGYGAIHTVEVSALRFTPHGDVTAKAALNLQVGSSARYDATNINLGFGWQPR